MYRKKIFVENCMNSDTNNPVMKGVEYILSQPPIKLKTQISHKKFFQRVLDTEISLSNDRDATCFCSWKVGGQDFYIYGIEHK